MSYYICSSGGFQSTLSARRATQKFLHKFPLCSNFNPRSPRGERLAIRLVIPSQENFNPRSPRGERHAHFSFKISIYKFQSTLSARRATSSVLFCGPPHQISIHALREESDLRGTTNMSYITNFNPRSPRGERLNSLSESPSSSRFQSTLSARRATLQLIP